MAVTFPRPSAKSNYAMKLVSLEAVSQKRDRGDMSYLPSHYCFG